MELTAENLKAEFDTDPAGIGYKSAPVEADGYKATKQLAHLLGSGRSKPNPEPAKQVPKPVDIDAMIGALPDTTIAKIDTTGFAQIRQAIDSGDRKGAARWLKIARAKSWLTVAELNGLKTQLEATVADPDHPATVAVQPRIVELFGVGGITHQQIDEALGRNN